MNMRLTLLFLSLIVAFNVFAGKITDDELILGKPGSSSDIEIKDPSKTNILKVNRTTNTWQFSNDSGANFLDIGSGGGGGSGALNVLENPNAEQGLTKISNTGGTLTEVSSPASDVLEGKKSFRFDPASQNDVVQFDAVTISKGLYQRSCEARINYIGGDEESIIEVVDANSDVLGSLQMPSHSIYGPESVFFLCPSETEVGGDANKGILTLRVRQSTTNNGAEFTFDENHLGGLIGLAETVIPDVTSAVFFEGNIVSQQGDSVQSITWGASTFTGVTFKAGEFSVIPNINCQVDVGNSGGLSGRTASVYDVSTSGFKVTTENSTPSITNGYTLNCTFIKQGVDAKQSVQVYKSIPKVSENVNTLVANFDSSGNLLYSNVSGVFSAVANGSGSYTVTHNAGLTLAPIVSSEDQSTSPSTNCNAYSSTATTSSVICYNTTAGTGLNREFNFTLTKRGVDFKLPVVQPVIINQVQTSLQNGTTTNVCHINATTGTPVSFNPLLCGSWIDSYTDNGVGLIQVNFKAGIFSDSNEIVCECTAPDNDICGVRTLPTTSSVEFSTRQLGSGSLIDTRAHVSCTGGR